MAITVKERQKFRRTTGSEAERRYVIRDSAGATITEATARSNLLTTAPVVVNSLQRLDLVCEVEEIAENIYEGVAKYGFPQFEAPAVNTTVISFDISGTQTKVKQSPNHIADFVAGGFSQVDFKGAIGVTHDGDVEGVDILVPQLAYTITKTYAEADVTATYVQTLASAVGTTNITTYRGFTQNTLLLTRVSGQPRPDPANSANTVYDITFCFAYSATKASLNIGNGITVTDKHGWDYVWVYYEPELDTSAKVIRPIPKQACLERVIPATEFALLNI